MSEADINLPKVDAVDVSSLVLPRAFDVAFQGFRPEAFEVLSTLRARPHIDCYREQKDAIEEHIKKPFNSYRDDLVVNIVLPNGLNLETERNVFSRFLKNDFGAGGCHHHKWLSFYRPERRRLTDIQLAHSLSPEGLRISVYAGQQAKDAFRRARREILAAPPSFLQIINPLLQENHVTLAIHDGTPVSNATAIEHALDQLPNGISNATGIAVRTTIPREEVLKLKSELMPLVFERVAQLWPIYRFLIG